MAITEGWCLEARCDRCQRLEYWPHSATLEAEDNARRRGWREIGGGQWLCPACARLREQAEAAQQRAHRACQRRARERRRRERAER